MRNRTGRPKKTVFSDFVTLHGVAFFLIVEWAEILHAKSFYESFTHAKHIWSIRKKGLHNRTSQNH